jgi:pimeloyl-ACP methyl ester carboxylesterase
LPFVTIDESPLAPDVSPVEIHYREVGSGPPLVFLHGGWGYEIYPFDRQIDALQDRFRIVIPDRTGYGRSRRLTHVPVDFHARAAVETMRLLDALQIERPVLWGHSDGAVIAAKIGLAAPDRMAGLILEAFHFYRVKPGSREFFEVMAGDPALLGERVGSTLAREHGEDYWHKLIVINGNAWLAIADEAAHARHDLYDGELSELRVPALFIHGSRDPRTEPGELDAVRAQLPNARIEVIEGGGHSPHSESASAAESNRVANEFLVSIG